MQTVDKLLEIVAGIFVLLNQQGDALDKLLGKDFITHDKGIYTVYDPFFALWVRQNA